MHFRREKLQKVHTLKKITLGEGRGGREGGLLTPQTADNFSFHVIGIVPPSGWDHCSDLTGAAPQVPTEMQSHLVTTGQADHI